MPSGIASIIARLRAKSSRLWANLIGSWRGMTIGGISGSAAPGSAAAEAGGAGNGAAAVCAAAVWAVGAAGLAGWGRPWPAQAPRAAASTSSAARGAAHRQGPMAVPR